MFQITHNMAGFGIQISNAYHVERANSGENAQEINDAFSNSVLPEIRLLQSDSLINVDQVCFNLGDPEDFHTADLGSAPGLRTVVNSPTFLAPAIRFPSLNRNVRAGQKRFAGTGEEDYVVGVLQPTITGLLEDIADAMIANWLASADSHHVCNYVIIKRVCETEDPGTGKCLKYKLPDTTVDLVFYTPTAYTINPSISSQVSRKQF